ncbi:MAG: 50S ribosomal protein L29 [Patescibacteria group bacterium]
MKKQEKEQFKNKLFSELKKILTDSRENLKKLKFDLAAGKVKNIQSIKETKKIIARALTIINMK